MGEVWLGLVADPVIKAIGRLDFEDDSMGGLCCSGETLQFKVPAPSSSSQFLASRRTKVLAAVSRTACLKLVYLVDML